MKSSKVQFSDTLRETSKTTLTGKSFGSDPIENQQADFIVEDSILEFHKLNDPGIHGKFSLEHIKQSKKDILQRTVVNVTGGLIQNLDFMVHREKKLFEKLDNNPKFRQEFYEELKKDPELMRADEDDLLMHRLSGQNLANLRSKI